MGAGVCLHACVCVCAVCVPSSLRGQMRTLAPLELDLQIFVSRHVGAVNGAWVPQVVQGGKGLLYKTDDPLNIPNGREEKKNNSTKWSSPHEHSGIFTP